MPPILLCFGGCLAYSCGMPLEELQSGLELLAGGHTGLGFGAQMEKHRTIRAHGRGVVLLQDVHRAGRPPGDSEEERQAEVAIVLQARDESGIRLGFSVLFALSSSRRQQMCPSQRLGAHVTQTSGEIVVWRRTRRPRAVG